MRRLRQIVTAVTIMVAAVTPVARATDLPVLSGRMTIVATHPYQLLVRVPHPSKVDISDVSLDGQGREFGFVLRRVGAGSQQPMLVGLTAGHCTVAACPDRGYFGANGVFGHGQQGTTGLLPAGLYRLYVVADGRPVRITAKIGDAGSTTIRTGARYLPHLALPPASDDGPGHTTYAGGTTIDAGSQGGFMHIVSWKVLPTPDSANNVGLCMHRPGSAWIGAPYQVPCDADQLNTGFLSGESNVGDDSVVGPGARYMSDFESFGLVSPGNTSVGAFNDGEVPASEAHTQVFWLPFEMH